MSGLVYPNQKTIRFNSNKEPDKTKAYAKIYIESSNEAISRLSQNSHALVLYYYFCTFEPKFELHLSRSDFMKKFNISKNTYLNAIQLLIDQSYLVKSAVETNVYDFYPYPKVEKNTALKKENKKTKEIKNQEVFETIIQVHDFENEQEKKPFDISQF